MGASLSPVGHGGAESLAPDGLTSSALSSFWNTTSVSYITPLLHSKNTPVGQALGIFGASAFTNLDLEEAK